MCNICLFNERRDYRALPDALCGPDVSGSRMQADNKTKLTVADQKNAHIPPHGLSECRARCSRGRWL